MKLVKGGDEETPEVTACPRVSVMEGHTAHVLLHGVETPTEQSSLEMHVMVMKQGKGARLEMGVAEACSHDAGESGARSHTETTEERCDVSFGTPYKVQLKNDGDDRWLEVTVTEVEREERAPRTACTGSCPVMQAAAEAESDGCAMDAVGEIVECLCDVLSDAATSAFGWVMESNEEMEPTTPEYLVQPAQYVPPSASLPVARVVSVEAATSCPACTAASCPQAASGCVQCVGTGCLVISETKQPAVHIGIDTLHHRVVMETTDGIKHYKTSADRITVHDGCLVLEGNVHMESPGVDGSVVEVTGEKIRLDAAEGGGLPDRRLSAA